MKTLVLLSGGVDSSTCLARAIHEVGAENVVALSILYGQKHQKEMESAKAVADYYHVDLYSYDLSEIFQYSKCSLLEGSEEEIIHTKDGDAGVLLPVFSDHKDLDAGSIPEEDVRLADEILKILKDPALATDLSAKGKTRAADFSEEAYINNCLEFFS